MKYHAIEAYTLDELIDRVGELLSEGWKPLGGVAVAAWGESDTHYAHNVYAQAMVKEDADA